MPVTFKTAPHNANKHTDFSLKTNADAFFKTDYSIDEAVESIIGSSFVDPTERILLKGNGFVDTVLHAYNQHYDLVIRPDDVWITILCQLSYYINAHAEELRKKFVSHEATKELVLEIPESALEDINWNYVGDGMNNLLDNNLVDKELKNWITPTFSTTTRTDKTVSAILMMASMKKYFGFTFQMMCGIPNVTLEGTKEDWIDIQTRLGKLDSWGAATKTWNTLLQPILKRFISAFDGDIDEDFWAHIVSSSSYGSGSRCISGWITAFCLFNKRGEFTEQCEKFGMKRYILEGMLYPDIDSHDIPPGSAEVDVKIIGSDTQEYHSVLYAGNMGMKVVSGSEENGDRVQNVPMWCCCLKKEKKNVGH